MNDQELFDNFYYACITYAEDNGSAISNDDSFCKLKDNGDQKITILSWNHDSKQPTNDQLKQYSSQQIKNKQQRRMGQKLVNNERVIPTFTTVQRDLISPTNGMVIYNSTTLQLEVYINTWRGISLI